MGGSSVPSATGLLSGNKLTEPAQPTRTGYTFEGWYKDYNCTESWSFSADMVTGNATLYAKWIDATSVATYTVTFNSKGGSNVPSATGLLSGDKLMEPARPTRTDYTFNGWYKDEACTQPWNFVSDKVTANITLYAKWTAKDSGGNDPNPNTAVATNEVLPLKLYPTITSGELTVESDKFDNAETIRVYSLSGALVATYPTAGAQTSLNVSALPSGTYVVKVGRYAGKFVKQ
jgi:uncharacterized repeat protein (TIGR02543 family)